VPVAAPERDAIMAALERLLAWPEIARSPQLGKFLDYIVRRTLDGDEQSIKAYSIAVDVLGRGEDFDPQSDPIVRVQARRLRGLLDEYYRTDGATESLQILLPVGRYVPEFAHDALLPSGSGVQAASADQARTARPGGVTLSWFALVAIAAGVGLLAYSLSTWGPRKGALAAADAMKPPNVTIVEFQNLADAGMPAPQVSGLAIELVTDLGQFEDIEVRYGGTGGESSGVTAEVPASDFVLTGIVRLDRDVVQYSAILTDTRTTSVVWSHTIPVSASDAGAMDVLDLVSRRLSLILGSSRGPLHARTRQFLASETPAGEQVSLYLCRIMFDVYRDTGGASDAERAGACITALPETERQNPVALAISASLTAELADPQIAPDVSVDDRFRIAATNLERAIGLSPISSFIWEQRARLQEDMGDARMARADFGSSLQLNPANADALAAYARLLAFGGELAQARPLAGEAVEHSPSAPPWYQVVPALAALRDANYADAIARAELYAQADRELGPILAIMAGQGAGDSAVVNRYLPQVLDVAAFRAGGVLPRLRQRITDEVLIEAIGGALLNAGVPRDALDRAY
jgi:TolB-like protein/Flp pilus assembly protein TadD